MKYAPSADCVDCGISGGDARYEPPDSDHAGPAGVDGVTAPEPTCQLVGEILASLELGNYAPPAARAPKVAAGAKRCVTMRLSRDQRQCLVDGLDQSDLAYCVPALFPDVAITIVTPASCDTLGPAVRAQLTAQQGANTPTPKEWETNLALFTESCRNDRWTPNMLNCMKSTNAVQYPQNCAYERPTPLWKKIEGRLATRSPAN